MSRFNKSKRLITNNEFNTVFIVNHKVHSKYFVAFLIKNNNNKRLGVVVGKKNHKFAVIRNRIKRIIREFFYANYDNFANIDLIIIAKKFNNYHKKELANDLLKLKDRINEISKDNFYYSD